MSSTPTSYLAHQIDANAIDLLPSGELLLWVAGQTQPIVFDAASPSRKSRREPSPTIRR